MRSLFKFSIIIVLFIATSHGTSLSQEDPKTVKSGADTAAQPRKTVPSFQPSLSADQIYELQRTKAINDIEKEILDWAKARFWLIAVVTLIVGFFGVRALVKDLIFSQLQDAAKASARAEAAAEIARDSAVDTTKHLRAFGDTLIALEDQTKEIERSVVETKENFEEERKALQANASHAVASAELEVAELKEQLSQLTTLVEKLAKTSEQHHDLLSVFEQSRQETTRKQQSQREHFEQNSKYRVMIAYYRGRPLPTATQIFDMLKEIGFKVSEGKWAEESKEAKEVKIRHKKRAEAKAEEIRAMLTPLLKNTRLEITSFRLEDEDSRDDISILFL